MEEVAAKSSAESVFLLQHPLANPKDPPVVIPTLPRHRQQASSSTTATTSTMSATHVLPTSTSLPYSPSPPGSPIFGSRKVAHFNQSYRRTYSPSSGTATPASTSTTATTGGISSKAFQTHPTQLSLARDLTTRLWQREAELHTMKELYDAKIRRLTEMLQDAGVSPTEVENNLAVVAEETDGRRPLFDDDDLDGTTGDYQHPHLYHLVGGMVGVQRRQTVVEENSPVDYLFEEECSSIVLDDEPPEEEDGDPSEFMSNSGTLSLHSNSTTQLTKPDDGSLCHRPSGVMHKRASADTPSSFTSPAMTAAAASTPTTIPKRRSSSSRLSQAVRPFSPIACDISTASCPVNSRLQQQHQQHQEQQELSDCSKPGLATNSKAYANEGEAKAQAHGQDHQNQGQQPQGHTQDQTSGGTGNLNHGSLSPIPSFIADSFAASTLGMKTLREKLALASGVLSWSKSTKIEQNNTNTNSVATSPNGFFIRRGSIANDKKSALVEASIPPPIHGNFSPSETKDSNDKERESWTSILSSTSRKQHSTGLSTQALQARPMSEVGFLGSQANYSPFTMARDIPRPPITRIHDYLQRPDSYNPSPLHYRAISIAANLIDTGAITPAKLYARRTQSMIAKWTLGLIMNTKPSKSQQSSFPVIRESLSPEQEEMLSHHYHPDNNDNNDMFCRQQTTSPSLQDNLKGLEMVSSNRRFSETLNPTELPKALPYKSHSTTLSLTSSSFPHTSSLSYYQSHHLNSAQTIVELSDISSQTLSMSPPFTCLGEAVGKPLTDRYGFLVNARPMAVQHGLMKLSQAHAFDGLETPTFERPIYSKNTLRITGKDGGNTSFECLMTPADDSSAGSGQPSSSPPTLSSFYFGAGNSGTLGTFTATGNATVSATTASSPSNITSPILSTATRPTSTLSPPTSSTATVTTLLSQIKVLHDSVQITQKEKWDTFLRKRRRRVHLGETNGGALANMSSTNLSSPLFGNLMLSLEDQEHDDEDVMYWTSVCLIGIATIGKGSDWEEFRDLARGGIPVAYRNKIWQETSGALDMRLPGYYKELLSRQSLESCQCWSDIKMVSRR
ncbi:hypothetical protein BX616_010921 [Lobosporangium transversale]|nr:hypothetical protein BX616_010921 [Lobosporangium transversale]